MAGTRMDKGVQPILSRGHRLTPSGRQVGGLVPPTYSFRWDKKRDKSVNLNPKWES
jgi:hypothetical protein